MPTDACLCRGCGRPFGNDMSILEKEAWMPRCPVCGSAKVEPQLFGFSFGGSGGGQPAPGG
ncbi:MAG: hypothetical protein H6Q81_2496 [Deltaproteobacteria bacterium]|nr:hypothetical protein [Deltaproteobacteria bacterium]